MNYKLVKLNTKYDKSFNIGGFAIFSSPAWDNLSEQLKISFTTENIQINFGENESVTFTSWEDFSGDLEVLDITEEEATTLARLFNNVDDSLEFYYEFGNIIETIVSGEDDNEGEEWKKV